MDPHMKAMYQGLQLGTNPTCIDCRKADPELRKPVSYWHWGTDFNQDRYKVLFVGKVARDEVGVEVDGIFDATEAGRDMLLTYPWPYWSYTRQIAVELYGGPTEEAIERIAFTNLIKCNSSDGVDRTTPTCKESCINKLHVFKREVEVIKPRNIVLYTGLGYDGNLERLALTEDTKDHTDQNHRVRCGGKMIGWWHRDYLRDGQVVYRVLRTHHPERKKREEFIKLIADWVKADGV